MMGTIITIDNCHKLASLKNGKCLSTQYKNYGSKLLWECQNKHQWLASYGNIRAGKWCSICARCKKHTLEYCHELAAKNNGKCLSTEYKNVDEKMSWQCSKGHIWSTRLVKIIIGHWCPICALESQIGNIEDCKGVALKNNGKCLEPKYKNNYTKMLWECEHGHQWRAPFSNVKRGGWCPKCAKQKRKNADHKIKKCRDVAEKNGGKCLSPIYTNAKTKLLWECGCGNQWETTYRSVVVVGSWCAKCCNRKAQKKIYKYIKDIFYNYNVYSNYKKFDWLKTTNKGYLEFDICIPDLKLAIEYDGEQHFFPVCFGGMSTESAKQSFIKTKKRDRLKNEKVKRNPQDIRFFIRFDYKEKINKEYILNKIYSTVSKIDNNNIILAYLERAQKEQSPNDITTK